MRRKSASAPGWCILLHRISVCHMILCLDNPTCGKQSIVVPRKMFAQKPAISKIVVPLDKLNLLSPLQAQFVRTSCRKVVCDAMSAIIHAEEVANKRAGTPAICPVLHTDDKQHISRSSLPRLHRIRHARNKRCPPTPRSSISRMRVRTFLDVEVNGDLTRATPAQAL